MGDHEGFGLLYRSLNPPLLRYLRHHAPTVAEDLASEVWVAATRNLPSFDGDIAQFRTWLFTVAKRRLVDHYRSQRRRRSVALEVVPEPRDPMDLQAAVTAQLSAQEAVNLLVRALPADQAEVVLLRVLGDLSVEQVAHVMGRSRGAVRALQHRAIKRLQQTYPSPAQPVAAPTPRVTPRYLARRLSALNG
jgi:RNA polymerase sigma-70 factor (ECF subfamily)